MLSIAPVASAAGAASYYSADNYYSTGQLAEQSSWHGRGAADLGLQGPVDQQRFEAVLSGRMPDGGLIGEGTRGERRAGFDLTFSAPKSVSLLAYVGGDRRLLEAHLASVRTALDWAEQRLAATRMTEAGGNRQSVPTGRLLVALFQHDTSRLLDPQAHVHAVVVNATRDPARQWRALDGHPLWQHRTAIASVYNASFRQAVERLGYQTETIGRHNQFEIAGVSREAIAAFSQRRTEIVGTAERLEHQTPAAMQAVALRTRGAKPEEVDRASLHADWASRADAIGFRPTALVADALMRASRGQEPWQRIVDGVKGLACQARHLAEHLGLIDPQNPVDPLVPERPGRVHPLDYAAAHAVAAGARHLGEREAGWARADLVKAALDLGARVPVAAIEERIDRLMAKGLLAGDAAGRMLTTAEAVAQEQAFTAAVAEGRGASGPLLGRDPTDKGPARDGQWQRKDAAAAQPREQATTLPRSGKGTARDAQGNRAPGRKGTGRAQNPADPSALARTRVSAEAASAGLRLTRGQTAAAVRILASDDRVVPIQGDAGCGKSSMLAPVARLAEQEGRAVLGLAVSNAIAQRLGSDVGIPTSTIAKFLWQHRALLEPGNTDAANASRDVLRGAVLFVDEASMLATREALQLVRIANAAGVARLVLVGDRQQLGAVEAGRPFADLQDQRTVRMTENLRARTDIVRLAHAAAQGHDMKALGAIMAERTTETDATAREAAARWMALPPQERVATSIFVTGRALRSAINTAIQEVRAEAGETAPGLTIRGALTEVYLTREQQRHPTSYRPGQVIELARPLTAQGLPAGRMTITAREDQGRFRVRLEDGREGRFTPGRLAANRVPGAVRMFEARDLEVRAGDPILWRTNDPGRGIVNGSRAVLAEVDKGEARFLMADGKVLRLPTEDPVLRRIDLAYALNAHSAQGATADKAIIVARADEGPLLSQPLLAVLFTRPREAVDLITDRLDALMGRAARNSGEKLSATDIAGRPAESKQMELALQPPEPEKPVQRVREKVRDMSIGW